MNDTVVFGPSETTETYRKLFQFLERKSPTEYDRIMDAVYRETRIGGGCHRTFDGAHTLYGSYTAIHPETGDVDFFEYVKAHVNELVTPEGIPLFTLDRVSLDHVSAEVLETLGEVVTAGQVRNYVRDMNSVNAGELVSAAFGSLILFAAFRSGDRRAISRMLGANLACGLIAANPVQVGIGLCGLAYAVRSKQIRSWELLKGSAPPLSGTIGYQVGRHVLDLSGAESLLLGLAAGVATSALLAHLDERNRGEIVYEIGENAQYVAMLTPDLLRHELQVLECRQPSLSLSL